MNQRDLHGESPIAVEHVQNNKSVRKMLVDRGIKPEKLPPEEDLQKLGRQIKSDEKRIITISKLPKKLKNGK